MKAPALLGLLVALVTPPAQARFGIAVLSGDGACVALQGGPVERGTDLTLVVPETPQTLFRARIRGPRTSCEGLERANATGPYYELEGLPADANSPLAIAILGSTQAALAGGVATVALAGTEEPVTVRSCTSHEGLHLTAWAGEPLDGRRLWHAYWYLGYDVEASCTVNEME